MTPNAITAIIDGILARETDQYTNHPKDKGGPTKYGITLATLTKWRKAKVTAADVEGLTEIEAREIYETTYIRGPRFDLINDNGLATLLIDWGVMSGPDDAVKGLQRVLNMHGADLKVDGVLGPRTANVANNFGKASELRNYVCDDKIIFHVNDVQDRPSQLVFLEGWVRRTLAFRQN